jgi:hypothetical protein
METDYARDLAKARKALAELLRRREELEVQIAKQRQTVAALAVLCKHIPERSNMMAEIDFGGLTDSCRAALRAAGPQGLTPPELRASLRRMNFPVDEYSNALATIHSVLKRLEGYKEVRVAIHDRHEGRNLSVYQWIGPTYGASRSLANSFADADRDERRTNR